MKPSVLFLSILGTLSVLSSSAIANPVSCEIFRAQQPPNSTHVQLSLVDQCDQNIEIRSLTRDGTTLNTDWQPIDGFTANMGSGLDTAPARQFCDCDLPVGSHTFKLSFRIKSDGETYDGTFVDTIDVLSTADMNAQTADTEIPDAGEMDSEMMPWDEPEPQEIQGIDCIAACKTGGPGTEEGAAATGEKSGCSVVAVADDLPAFPLLLILLGLVPIWLLKRQKHNH
jgi:hypothetical protein